MPPVVAAVASLVVILAGVSTVATVLWTIVIGIASASYARNHQPKFADPSDNRRHTSRISDSPLILLYGKRRISGPLIFWTTGNASVSIDSLVMCIAFCEHEIEGIDKVYLGDKLAYDGDDLSPSVATALTHDDIPPEDRVTIYLGRPGQVADPTLLSVNTNTVWTEDHKGERMAYIVVYLNSFNDWELIPDVSVIARGRKLYDPRKDGSRLGVGTHNYDDETTWEYSINPALAVRDYLTREEGFQESHAKMDDAWVIQSANTCDFAVEVPLTVTSTNISFVSNNTINITSEAFPSMEVGSKFLVIGSAGNSQEYTVNTYTTNQIITEETTIVNESAGPSIRISGSQKRYTCNIGISTNNSRQENLQQLLDTMKGEAVYVGGLWKIMSGEFTVPTVTITEDDIVSELVVSQSTPASNTYNYITGLYYDEERFYQKVNFNPRSNSAFEVRDGNRRIPKDIKLMGITNEYQAQRIATLELNFSAHQTMVKITVRPRGDLIDLHVNSLVNLTITNPSWTTKPFRVEKWEINEDLSINLLLRDENTEAWDVPVTIYGDQADPTGYDPYNQYDIAPPTSVTFETGESTQKILQGGAIQAVGRLNWVPSTHAVIAGYRTRWRPASAAGAFSSAVFDYASSFYFKGDETSGLTAINSSTKVVTANYGVDASAVGMSVTALTTQEAGTAINVAAIADRILTMDPASVIPITRDFTACIAFKVNTALEDITILGQWGDIEVAKTFKIGTLEGSTNISITLIGSDATVYTIDSGSSYSDAAAHFLAVTLKTDTVTLEIDDVAVGTLDLTGVTLIMSETYGYTVGGGHKVSASVVSPTDYIAYWTMDDAQVSGTTLLDLTSNNHDATMVNTPTTGEIGQKGEAVLFESANSEYATVAQDAALRPISLTMSAWVKLSTPSANGRVLSNTNKTDTNTISWGYDLGVDINGKVFLGIYDGLNLEVVSGTVRSLSSVDDDNLHHVVATLDNTSGDLKIYIDGVLENTTTGMTGKLLYSGTHGFRIGNSFFATETFYFDGRIDDLKIFDRAITADEVTAMFIADGGMLYDPQDYVARWELESSSVSPITGLLAHYKLDGDLLDSSGGGHNGTSVNTLSYVAGQIGEAVVFTGVENDSVNITDVAALRPSTFTVMVWVKTSASAGVIFSSYDSTGNLNSGFNARLLAGKLDFLVGDDTGLFARAISSGTVNDNTWKFLSFTYDGATAKVYVDKILVGSVSYTDGVIYLGTNGVYIGARKQGGAVTDMFTGNVDDLHFYDHALTAQEITDYDGTLGNTVLDSTYRNHDGTINSAPVFGAAQIGNGLTFDGVDDYISIVNHADLRPTELTISFWNKATSENGVISKWSSITSTNSGWRTANRWIELGSNTGLTQGVHWEGLALSAADQATVIDGEWHLTTFTYDGSIIKSYLDGKLSSTINYSGGLNYDISTLLLLGAVTFNGTDIVGYFDGSLDDVRIYPRALSQLEISSIFHSRNVAPPQDFVAEWLFDGNGNETLGNHNATPVGTPTYATGKELQAVVLNGVDQYFTVVDHASLKPSSLTIAAWVNTSGIQMSIFSKSGVAGQRYGYELYVGSTGALALEIARGTGTEADTDWKTTTSISKVNTSEWVHVAATFDENFLRLYVNGVLENTEAFAFSIAYLIDTAVIGHRLHGPTPDRFFDGSIDKVQLFNRACTAEEIAAMAAQVPLTAGAPPLSFEESVVSAIPTWYWKLDETSGTIAVDRMGNFDLLYGTAASEAGYSIPSSTADGVGQAKYSQNISSRNIFANNDQILGALTSQDFTIEAAIRYDSDQGYSIFIGKWANSASSQRSWQLGTTNTNALRFAFYEADSTLRDLIVWTQAQGFVFDQWFYVSVRMDYSTTGLLTVEVDGDEKLSLDVSGWSGSWRIDTSSMFRVFRDDHLTDNLVDGAVDEVAIYLKAITDEERAANYEAWSTGLTSGGEGGQTGVVGFDGTWDDAAFWNKALLPYERRNLYKLWKDGVVAEGLDTEWRNFFVGQNEILWDVDLENQHFYDFSIETRNLRGLYSPSVILLGREVLASNDGPDQLSTITSVAAPNGAILTVDSSSVFNADIAQIEWVLSPTNNRLDVSAVSYLESVPSPRIGALHGIPTITSTLLFEGTKWAWARLVNLSGLTGSWNSGDVAGVEVDSGPQVETGTINFIPPALRDLETVTHNYTFANETILYGHGWINMYNEDILGAYLSCSTDINNIDAGSGFLYIEFYDNLNIIETDFKVAINPIPATETKIKLEGIKSPITAVLCRMRLELDTGSVTINKTVFNEGLSVIGSGTTASDQLLNPNDDTTDLGTINDGDNLLDGDVDDVFDNTATVDTSAGGGPYDDFIYVSGGGFFQWP